MATAILRRIRARDRGRRGSMPQLDLLEPRTLLTVSTISGYVFNDLTNIGLKQPSDPGLASSNIELLNSTGTVIGTTTSSASGYYQFTTDASINTAPQVITETATIPLQQPNYTQTTTVPQFNPALGTLTSVDINVLGSVNGDIKMENLGSQPEVLMGTLAGTLTTTAPGVAGLVVNPAQTQTFNASAFDGVIDFAGTSGHDFGNQTVDASGSASVTNALDLASYEGPGTVNLTEQVVSDSSGTGPGNVLAAITSEAGAVINVVYHYIPGDNIVPGQYTVVQTTQPSGFLPGQVSSGGVILPNAFTSRAIPITFNGTLSENNNFAEIQPASIGGFVYFDANNNGIKESNEFGIAHVVITLTGTTDVGQSVSMATTTADDGSYSFNTLRPGIYNITETPPPVFRPGKDTIGTPGGDTSQYHFSNIVLSAGFNGEDNNFGHLPAPGCKLYCLAFHASNGQRLPILPGPQIQYYLPTLVAASERMHPTFTGLIEHYNAVHPYKPVHAVVSRTIAATSHAAFATHPAPVAHAVVAAHYDRFASALATESARLVWRHKRGRG